MVADLVDGAADELRGPKHGRRVEQRLDLPGVGILEPSCSRLTTDGRSRGCRPSPAAMTRSPGRSKSVQLAEGRDVVEPGIGAGVGDHHEAVANEDAGAVGHRVPGIRCLVERSRTRASLWLADCDWFWAIRATLHILGLSSPQAVSRCRAPASRHRNRGPKATRTCASRRADEWRDRSPPSRGRRHRPPPSHVRRSDRRRRHRARDSR